MRKITRFGVGAIAAIGIAILGLSAASAAPTIPNAPVVPDKPSAVQPLSTNPVLQNVYVPITPCRVLDTRLGGGPIGGGSIRNVYVSGTFGFAPQGGKTGGCGVPLTATAVAATVLSVNSTATGRITAYPSAAGAPTATTLYFSKGVTTSTGATLSLSPGSAKQLAVKSYATTDVVIDISGYYAKQIYGTFTDTGTVYDGNGTLTAYSHGSTGSYGVQSGRDLTGCSVVTSAYYYAYNTSSYISGSVIYVYLTNNDGTPIDYYFYVQVSC